MRRRGFLALTAGWTLLPARLGEAAEPEVRDEAPEVMTSIGESLKAAGVGPVRGLATRYYMSAGDIDAFDRRRIGLYCDGMLTRARALFATAGIPLKQPESRFNFVAVSDPAAFQRLATAREANSAHGFYDYHLKAVFFTPMMNEETGLPDWEQTMPIVAHEAMHQITWSLGPLDPSSDVPSCISEGMAALAEDATNHSPTLSGGVPRTRRIDVEAIRGSPSSMEEMFASDKAFFAPTGLAHRYAQSWLLVRMLMTAKDLLPGFRAYLKAIAARTDHEHRLDDARQHLGDLDDLLSRALALGGRLLSRQESRYTSTRRVSN